MAGQLFFDELKTATAAGEIDTVLACIIDMQGRLAGSGRGFQFVKGNLSSHDMSSLGKVGGKPAALSFPLRLHGFRVLMEP